MTVKTGFNWLFQRYTVLYQFLIKHDVTKTYRGVVVQVQAFLISAPDAAIHRMILRCSYGTIF
jgi:hypothetical protein